MKTIEIHPKLLSLACGLALLGLGILSAQADSYTAAYPSGSSTVVASVGRISATEYGYFWSQQRGDMVGQVFGGTGLGSVDQLNLSIPITQNYLNSGNEVDWGVYVNSIEVGHWTWTDAMGKGLLDVSYTFPAIAGGGTYNIEMYVLNTVPPGGGSIALGYGQMTLGVPDGGSTLGLLALGVFGLGAVSLRKRSLAK